MPKRSEKVNVEVYLEDVQLSHPHLFAPQSYRGDKSSKPRHTAVFMLHKKNHKALIEEIEDGIEEIREKMFDGRKLKADNICLSDGDDTDKPEYQGHMILRGASPEDRPPELLGRDKRPIGPKDRKLYGGCFVNAIVRLYGYDEYADQVNCSIEAVQHYRKGESFGAGPADTSKFKDYGDDDEDDRDDRPLRDKRRNEDDDDRGSRRGRDEERGSRSRDRDDDRGSRRGRDDDDRGSRRSRDEDDRGSRRSRDDDASDRGSRRSRDDDDRGSRRRRDRDDD